MPRITTKAIVRSVLVALFMTVEGMTLQVVESVLVQHSGPPAPGRLVGLIVCYLAAAFTYALGFFLLLERLPGRSSVGKGLRYAGVVLTAVWISGFINLAAVDFQGGWNLLSPLKVDAFWMGVVDCANFLMGGLVLGLMTRKEWHAMLPAPFTANLAARIAAGAVLLPALCAGVFHSVERVLPGGLDLSGERRSVFDVFLFVPLLISGAGTALFQDFQMTRPPGNIVSQTLRGCLFLFFLYWVPNAVFVLFFGFSWQILVDFLVAMAVALFLTMMVMQSIARVRSPVAVPQ